MRGVRGATTLERNDAAHMRERTTELLSAVVERNGIRPEQLASVIFTTTDDLDADFPAHAARALPGWDLVPLMCAREIAVPSALASCLRVLLHWNTDRGQHEVKHVYLHGATALRPDLGEE